MIRLSAAICLALAAASSACITAAIASVQAETAPAAHPQAAATLAVMSRVAEWQMAHPSKHPTTDWTSGAIYSGFTHFALVSPDAKYLNYLRELGEQEKWLLDGNRKRFFADDQAIAQTWIDLHRLDKKPVQIADTLAVMEDFIKRPDVAGPMKHTAANHNRRWTWCDSLFMAPPILAKLYADTKDPKWEEALLKDYKQTTDYLFDKEEALFYRDDSYFAKKEANGAKVFWSRGNGWVFAGLANILRELPSDAKSRPYFEDLFKKMAKRLAELQQADGSWHASLLDPASFPVPETSGTGFFTYGFAYGIKTGLLDDKTYSPVVAKGWARLVSCVDSDGKLGFVQPIGQDPKHVTADMTENYGVGAFLLAGTEIRELQLKGSTITTPAATAQVNSHVSARVVPERFDGQRQTKSKNIQSPPSEVIERLRLSSFYSKFVNCNGLPIVSSLRVDDQALLEAKWIVQQMLSTRPDLLHAIVEAPCGIRMAVMARDEFTTDLPEHADLEPKKFWDCRARGVGATDSRPCISCAEENLLQMPGDPYVGENITVHEFAHVIHMYGLARVDPTFNARLDETYKAALAKGRWKGSYAASNSLEYWAEGVQIWFGCNDDARTPCSSDRENLRAYDPEFAQLLKEVFRDNYWLYSPPSTRVKSCQHLHYYDPIQLPRFSWPN
jgi:rhamnogalacturonyl hydrolase YesR